jgi:hypothetical protein
MATVYRTHVRIATIFSELLGAARVGSHGPRSGMACDYDPQVPDQPSSTNDRANVGGSVPKSERVVTWALVASLIPIIGFAGGVVAMFKGWRRTGRYMILIALAVNLLYAAATSTH